MTYPFVSFPSLCSCVYKLFIDEINGDVEKEEEIVMDFTVHDSNV